MPIMLTRAFSLATNRVARAGFRSDVIAHQFRTMLQPTAAAAISTSSTVTYHGQRSISTSPPLQSSSDDNEGEGKKERTNEELMAIIHRRMKWNQAKTWRYEPNHDLIAQIGKEGTTSPLDAFRDLVPREKRAQEPVGRSWSVKELRRKSYDDLHKLWYVLYKEKNMLLTEANLARRHGYDLVQRDRRRKVRKSMGAIKHVLGERKRRKIADHKAYLEELERFDGLVANMNNLEMDPMEEGMDTEAEKISSSDKV